MILNQSLLVVEYGSWFVVVRVCWSERANEGMRAASGNRRHRLLDGSSGWLVPMMMSHPSSQMIAGILRSNARGLGLSLREPCDPARCWCIHSLGTSTESDSTADCCRCCIVPRCCLLLFRSTC